MKQPVKVVLIKVKQMFLVFKIAYEIELLTVISNTWAQNFYVCVLKTNQHMRYNCFILVAKSGIIEPVRQISEQFDGYNHTWGSIFDSEI